MKKVKKKTHKATAKRFKLTGSGKVTRTSKSHRKQRFSRTTNRKDKNTDRKGLELSKVEAKKVKQLLNI